jgi:hypothetical protein
MMRIKSLSLPHSGIRVPKETIVEFGEVAVIRRTSSLDVFRDGCFLVIITS